MTDTEINEAVARKFGLEFGANSLWHHCPIDLRGAFELPDSQQSPDLIEIFYEVKDK